MNKYNPTKAMKPTVRQTGEYCTKACGNQGCRANFKRCQKGERFTVSNFLGTENCRGYIRP